MKERLKLWWVPALQSIQRAKTRARTRVPKHVRRLVAPVGVVAPVRVAPPAALASQHVAVAPPSCVANQSSKGPSPA